MNRRKQKRRLSKSLARRHKEVDRYKTDRALRNIFIKAGVLKTEGGVT